MIQKTIIILLLSFTGGAGFMLGGAEVGAGFDFFNSEVGPVTKKKNLVKPKSFYSQRRAKISDIKYDQLSFFPILNDSSMNTMMGLNGQVISKAGYSPPPARVGRPEKIIRKKRPAPVVEVVPVRAGKTILKTAVKAPVVPTKVRTAFEGKRSGPRAEPLVKATRAVTGSSKTLASYAVQVASFRQWQRAEVLRSALEKKGYASFIGKTKLPGNKGTWYRVNIGAYLDHAGAERAAKKYFRKENQKAMVTRQSG